MKTWLAAVIGAVVVVSSIAFGFGLGWVAAGQRKPSVIESYESAQRVMANEQLQLERLAAEYDRIHEEIVVPSNMLAATAKTAEAKQTAAEGKQKGEALLEDVQKDIEAQKQKLLRATIRAKELEPK